MNVSNQYFLEQKLLLKISFLCNYLIMSSNLWGPRDADIVNHSGPDLLF